jgi:hypothetical protein
MTLLRDIQNHAASSKTSVADALRQARILAARLDSSQLASWVDRELNGYPSPSELPAYRIAQTPSVGHFVGVAGAQIKDVPVAPSALPKEFRTAISTERFVSGITVYESLLDSNSEGSFQKPWPAELLPYLHDNVYDGYGCLAAWKVIPRGVVVNIVDSVRNKLLAFTLDIERENPAAGEAAAGEVPVPSNTVTQVFNSHFYAAVGNVATAGTNVHQTTNVKLGDTTTLQNELQQLGIPAAATKELLTALEQDRASGEKGLGARAAAWIGTGIAKAASGAWSISLSTASAVLPKMIAAYLGIPD